MSDQIHYEQLYRNMIEQMELMHKDNLRRLRIGFRSIMVVPTIFLLLLLFTKSSKTIFLIMWIVSMFIIAAYLVIIEYSDFKLQNRINEATDNEGAQVSSLIQENIETNKKAMHELLMKEEERLPFKFGSSQFSDNEDEAEYDTGDFDDFLPAYANSFNPDLPEFDDDTAEYYDDSSIDKSYMSDDIEVTIPSTDSVQDSLNILEESLNESNDVENSTLNIYDIDENLDSIETLLDDNSSHTSEDSLDTVKEDNIVPPTTAVINSQNEINSENTEEFISDSYAISDKTEDAKLSASDIEDEYNLDQILSEYNINGLDDDFTLLDADTTFAYDDSDDSNI